MYLFKGKWRADSLWCCSMIIIRDLKRIFLFSLYFLEGTIVAKKDFYADKHSDELPIPNLEVLCLMRSFASKKFVTETFNWRYYYYILTPEGIDYLREYLALPADVVPATLRVPAAAPKPEGQERTYKDKNAGPGADFKPEFQREKPAREGYRS